MQKMNRNNQQYDQQPQDDYPPSNTNYNSIYENIDLNENPFASKKTKVANSPVGGSSKANDFSQASNMMQNDPSSMANAYPDSMDTGMDAGPSNLV